MCIDGLGVTLIGIRFANEMHIWYKLSHPRILQFLGFYVENEGYPYLISKWMKNGTVMEYLHDHPKADILSLVRVLTCASIISDLNSA